MFEKNADIEGNDNINRMPLFWAIENEYKVSVRLLLQESVGVEARGTGCGWVALLLDLENRHEAREVRMHFIKHRRNCNKLPRQCEGEKDGYRPAGGELEGGDRWAK